MAAAFAFLAGLVVAPALMFLLAAVERRWVEPSSESLERQTTSRPVRADESSVTTTDPPSSATVGPLGDPDRAVQPPSGAEATA